MVLPQSFLSAPHLHRAPARGGGPRGAPYPAAGPAPHRPRHGSGRQGRCAAGAPSCACSASCHCPLGPPPGCWEWTILPCGNGTPRARSWWTWSPGSPWHSCRIVPLSLSPSGSRHIPGWRASPGIGRGRMRREHARAHRQPSRWQTAFMGCTICGKLWITSSPHLPRPAMPSMPWSASRPCCCPMGWSQCPCHHPQSPPRPHSSVRCSARHTGRHCIRRSGLCLSKEGRARPWPSTWGCVSGRCRAISGPPRGRDASAAAPRGPGCAPPIKRIGASAGLPAARLPGGACARAVSAAMEEALAWGRPRPAVCVRRRASLLGTAARVRPGLPWPSRPAALDTASSPLAGAAAGRQAYRGRGPTAHPTPRAGGRER